MKYYGVYFLKLPIHFHKDIQSEARDTHRGNENNRLFDWISTLPVINVQQGQPSKTGLSRTLLSNYLEMNPVIPRYQKFVYKLQFDQIRSDVLRPQNGT